MDQAEQLRNIIKKQNQRKRLARVITVTSGKGGVGKSNLTVNLAIQFSRLGRRVVVLDADFGLANVEVMLGLRPRYSLADLLFRGKDLYDVLSPGPENIHFISGGSGLYELANLDDGQLQYLVQMMYELDHIADIILIDTGAGISRSVIDMALASPEVLLVATPEPTSITDAYALLKTLSKQKEFTSDIQIQMVANRTHSYQAGEELFEKLDAVAAKFLDVDMEYLGNVPYDEKLMRAVMQQRPVSVAYPNAASSKALQRLAALLEHREGVPVLRKGKGISGLLSRMFHAGR